MPGVDCTAQMTPEETKKVVIPELTDLSGPASEAFIAMAPNYMKELTEKIIHFKLLEDRERLRGQMRSILTILWNNTETKSSHLNLAKSRITPETRANNTEITI